jgi:uncharacterized protein (TIGR03067 family)
MTKTSVIRRCVLATAAGLALLGSSPSSAIAADDSAVVPALKPLQGTWATSENAGLDAKWEFKGDTFKATVDGMDYVGKIKVDDKAKPHSTLDLDLTDGPEDAKGKTAKGVYKVDGDTLVIAVSHPGHDRPTDFDPVPDEVHLFKLKKKG